MMCIKRILISLTLVVFSISFGYSQSKLNIDINGFVQDTAKAPIPGATIMLLNHSDSTLVKFTTTNLDGKFSIKNIKKDKYLLKLSHISFMPREIKINPNQTENIDLGALDMYPISEILMEVVVKAAQAPISFRGDTVEYDASLFKVPTGSTVEDLLRQLPGIEVDNQGNISSMGESVGKVYVDGNIFFSDDPKVVTRNLESQAVSKVQVFKEKSEQERLTGIDDGSQNKVMNLELKDEYKKGYFGKASVGGGTEDRWVANGSYNRFNKTSQLSFISYANNVNQTNVNWQDYSEFMGQSMNNRSDNGDFGFYNDRYYSYGIGLGSNFDGKGFTENYGAGVNYNLFKEKFKLNTNYFYNQSDLDYNQYSNRSTFLTDTIFHKLDTVNFDNFRNSHQFTTRLEYDIDSSNSIIFRTNVRLSTNNENNFQSQVFQDQNYSLINNNIMDNSNDSDAISLNSLLLYNHKFKKARRSFSASGNVIYQKNASLESINNENIFYQNLSLAEQISILNDLESDNYTIKSSAMYVEPLTKKISLMTFYNFSSEEQVSNKLAQNPENNQMFDSLSLYYNHRTIYNRVGSSLNYNHQGVNIALGGAWQNIELHSKYSVTEESDYLFSPLKRDFSNFVPYFNANVQLPNDIRISGSYNYSVKEPSIRFLQTAPDLTNPLYRTEGNPNLNPETSHRISTGAYYWSRASLFNASLHASYSLYDSQIVYNQNTEFVENIGYRTVSRPENVKGGNSFNAYLWSNFPIIRTKLTMNVVPSFSTNNSRVFINGIENITNRENMYLRTGFNLTLGQKLNLYIEGSAYNSDTSYSIQKEQNQRIINYSGTGEIKNGNLQKNPLSKEILVIQNIIAKQLIIHKI